MTEKTISITEGPILRQVMRLAWPAVSAMFLHTAMSITDAIWVGRLGADQMAAVISSMFVIWILYSLIGVVDTGTVAVLSRYYGAREFDKAAHAGRQAVILGIVGSAVVTGAGIPLASLAFKVMQTEPEVAQHGIPYLQIIFGIAFMVFMGELLSAIFRATGDTKTPLVVSSIAIGLNLVLDPLLILGLGPFPRLEVVGAALGTAISYLVGFSLYLIVMKRGKLTFRFNWTRTVQLDFKMLWQIIKIGTPASMAGVIFSVVYLFINRITAGYGTTAIAALGIGNRCESLSYLICWGFSLAVATLVGQNLGAKKPERAEKSVWYTVAITAGVTTLIAIAFVVLPRQITALFIDDPAVKEIAVDYLLILAISQPFMAVVIVLEGAFSGAGNTMPPMVISICHSVTRLPLAYLLCYTLDLGINGVFWAITLTTVASSIVIMIWFRRGRWKLKEVH
ncbi:MAG: MATE family efflux transporter [candidate division Zixibacteria bacterium]|nr:MATE family efflux transporter [candidate division Zixibacteria bacterium]